MKNLLSHAGKVKGMTPRRAAAMFHPSNGRSLFDLSRNTSTPSTLAEVLLDRTPMIEQLILDRKQQLIRENVGVDSRELHDTLMTEFGITCHLNI
jgi:hypothetical protein